MTNEQATKIIASLPEVAKASAWNDRVYIRLANLSKNSNGDRNLKIWIKGDTVTMEPYKGYLSDGASAGVAAIEAAAEKNNMKFVRL